jgi:hypothetical protein
MGGRMNNFSPRERAFRRFAILFALCAILFVLIHRAAEAAPFTPRLNLAYAVANEYWGGPPPNCTSLNREIVPDWEDGRAGQATIAIEPTPCVLEISTWLATRSPFKYVCAVMIHEAGHLHGFEHSSDRRNIMYPSSGRMPAICIRTIRRTGVR